MMYNKILKKIKKLIFGSENKDPTKKRILRLIKSLHPIIPEKELIRIGGFGDGGYILPNDLEGIEACFSPGVGPTSKFENECAQMGIKIFMADASVVEPEMSHPNMYFIKKFIGKEISEDFISLKNWMATTNIDSDSDLILQMDIEGYEYDVINSLPNEILRRFRIILIEFHVLQSLWNKNYWSKAYRTFKKLNKSHRCVHIHPNNCCGTKVVDGIEFPVVAEFTFYRKDRIGKYKKAKNYPHPLDQDNTNNPTLVLPKNWHK